MPKRKQVVTENDRRMHLLVGKGWDMETAARVVAFFNRLFEETYDAR